MEQHKSLFFFLFPLLFCSASGAKGYITLYKVVVLIAVIAKFLKHLPAHVKYFSPEDECLRFFLAWLLDGSVN